MRKFFKRLRYAFFPKFQPSKDEIGNTIIPVFTDQSGVTYYMHEDPINVLTGRGLSAMMYMEELLMRCTREYLLKHVAATKDAFTIKGGKMNVQQAITLNAQLEQRLAFHTALPDNIYKLASVVFFDPKTENAATYNQTVAERKINEWKKDPDAYAFFLRTPLKHLIPHLQLPENMRESGNYLRVMEKINQHHLSSLSEMLSKNTPINEM